MKITVDWGYGRTTEIGDQGFKSEYQVHEFIVNSDMVEALRVRTKSDIACRFNIMGDGKLRWGGGRYGGMDTQLYRTGSSHLRTPGRLEVGNLAIGSIWPASNPQTVIKKIEVYDFAGNRVGWIPVYDEVK